MKNKAEIVIIGGGVIGCSIAYELAKKGLTDIQIVEKSFLSSGSTGRCGGGIRQQWATAPNIEMAMKSVARFEELEDELEYDFEYRQGGYLVLAYTPQFVDNFKKNVILCTGAH